jgi:hypothetical protein
MTSQNRNNLFILLLILQTLGIVVYSMFSFINEGPNLFAVFFDNLKSLNWNGQFNLDFMSYLTISGIWIMWREKFSLTSIITGISAMILGILFFAPYLIFLFYKENTSIKKVLIGKHI